MSDTDKLRPEVQIAMRELREALRVQGVGSHGPQFTSIRAELVRLADENARLLAANRDAMDHFEQMKAELTIAHHERDRMFLDAREWATRFGEMEARAEKAEAELAALKARIADAHLVPLTKVVRGNGYSLAVSGTMSVIYVDELAGKLVRLVED